MRPESWRKRSWRKRLIAADWNCTCIPIVPRPEKNVTVCGIKSAGFCPVSRCTTSRGRLNSGTDRSPFDPVRRFLSPAQNCWSPTPLGCCRVVAKPSVMVGGRWTAFRPMNLVQSRIHIRPVPVTRFRKSVVRPNLILIRILKPPRTNLQTMPPTSLNLGWAAAL